MLGESPAGEADRVDCGVDGEDMIDVWIGVMLGFQ